MYLFALTGQWSAAIEQYKIYCHHLADELGIEPEPETVALLEQIKAGKVIKTRGNLHTAEQRQ
jgi:DNA-binding SARP family transcriptional activator